MLPEHRRPLDHRAVASTVAKVNIFLKNFFTPEKISGDGFKIVRGCEGCPAQDGESCRFVSHPEQMNWDGDFRPTWEQQGHGPDEKAV